MSGLMNWLKSFFQLGSSAPKPAAAPRAAAGAAAARVKPQRVQRGGYAAQRIDTVVMHSYNDAPQIAEVLREGITAIINVSAMNSTDRARLVDFMTGLKAGLGANSSRVSEDVYLLAPSSMDIEADEEELGEDDSDRLIFRP